MCVYVALGAEVRSCSSFHRSGSLRSSRRSNPAIHHQSCVPLGAVLEYLSLSRCVNNAFQFKQKTHEKNACLHQFVSLFLGLQFVNHFRMNMPTFDSKHHFSPIEFIQSGWRSADHTVTGLFCCWIFLGQGPVCLSVCLCLPRSFSRVAEFKCPYITQ